MKLTKKTKKRLKIAGIVVGVILLILLLLLFFKVPVIPTSMNGTIATGGSSGGGGGSAGTSTNTDDGLIFVPLGNLFTWFIPIDDSVDDATEESSNIWDNFIDAVSLKADGSSCTSNTQCLSGYCDLVTYATGGRCVIPVDNSRSTDDSRTISLTSECTRDSDCNKCANPDYDTCVSNKCECITPTTTETRITTCSDSDNAFSLFTRTSSDINYEEKGTCTIEGSRGVTDYCRNGLLVEYYCRNDGCTSETAVDCKVKLNRDDAFCYDGACTWLA